MSKQIIQVIKTWRTGSVSEFLLVESNLTREDIDDLCFKWSTEQGQGLEWKPSIAWDYVTDPRIKKLALELHLEGEASKISQVNQSIAEIQQLLNGL